ncbi:MAG: polymerase sigma factor FliA [Thermodesulfobacteriota bacterium]|nr:polymerase sigma factor FliA [Thermodesulfobacteriota bacterium]
MLTLRSEIDRYKKTSRMTFEEEKTECREDLILRYAPLVKYIADRMASRMPSNVSKDDLSSAGIIGLFDAIDNFDPGKGIKFETYASYRIRGAILDEIRKLDWVPRTVRRDIQDIKTAIGAFQARCGRDPEDHEISGEMGVDLETYYKMTGKASGVNMVSLDEYQGDNSETAVARIASGALSPFDEYRRNELKEVIADVLSDLQEKEQMVISLYYFDELTLKEIAQIMELTESRISQIHSKAVIMLRMKLKEYIES